MSSERSMGFATYDAMKPSGIDWFGEIPAHWRLRRLKASVRRCQNGLWGDEPNGRDDYICVRVADFDRLRFEVDISEPTYRSFEKRVAEDRVLSRGDLLLEKSGGGEQQPVGVVVLYDHDEPALCSNFIARMQVAAGYDPRFLSYLHAALYAARVNTRSINQSTGIQNLDSAHYLNAPVALPTYEEQAVIAAFLDRETAKIDALVAKKRRLIELLQEKRAALVTQAVAKGLDEGTPMKDSGIPGLGEIPRHWKVKRLKRISPEITVGVVVNPSSYVSAEGVPFLYGSDVREGSIAPEGARRISIEDSDSLGKSRLAAGDLVCVRVGAPGVTAVVPPELDGANCASLLIIRRSECFVSGWLCHAMNSHVVRCQVEIVQYGAAQEQFNVSHAVDFLVPTPPRDEQLRIERWITERTAIIDGVANRIEGGTNRLTELRTALISAAVTGKIDVRGEAA